MREKGIDVTLLRQNADLFYFTGTVQDGHLVVPAYDTPRFWVWRSYERALKDSPLAELDYIKSLRGLSQFKELVHSSTLGDAKVVGLEMDVLPASLYLFYTQKVWPHAKVVDISPMVRTIRSIKDAHEICQIRQAAHKVNVVLEKVPYFLKRSRTELDLAALIEAELRRQGHCGLMRMRIWNQEMGMDQVVSGSSAAIPSWTNTPVGGVGPHPAFGMGASFKEIKENEIVSVDIGGWHNGYCCDITRPFFLGQPPKEVLEAFEVVKALMAKLESLLKPGTIAGEIYQFAIDFVDSTGMSSHFMGVGNNRVSFIGHGLGIELDEFPFISKGNDMLLEPGMVIALEPKIILRNYGVIGLEDTYIIDNDGCQRLTMGKQELVVI